MTPTYEKCHGYLAEREGTYEYRCRRYDAVIDAMTWAEGKQLGHWDSMTIADLGAGWTEFGHRLTQRGFRGRYLPFDGAIDGHDILDMHWAVPTDLDWIVAIELLEHLTWPGSLVEEMLAKARRGVIITTPDSRHVDTLGMDDDHVTALTPADLNAMGLKWVDSFTLFPGTQWRTKGFESTHGDTLVAWSLT